MTKAELRANVRINLSDANITYYSDAEIDASLQDAYNHAVANSLCLVKTATVSWQSGLTYYDFVTLGVSDYLGTIAIFNNVTNQWLRDDLSLRDFDNLRQDWEIWNGQPQYWTPHSLKRIAVAPHLTTASGTFTLYYWATAPVLTFDNSAPLIATDVQAMLEEFSTGDMLETAEEATKAQLCWSRYYSELADYKKRCANLAKSDLLLRV